MFLAVASAVAVSALPVTGPEKLVAVTVPVEEISATLSIFPVILTPVEVVSNFLTSS